MFTLSDYQYNLPEDKIAQYPIIPADSCKLLVCTKNGESYELHDKEFGQIANSLTTDDVLIFNNTKVIKARVPLQNVRVVTQVGRKVELENGEIFLLQKIDETTCECLVSLLKRTRPGMKIYIKSSGVLQKYSAKNNNASSILNVNIEYESSNTENKIILEITELNERGVIIKMSGITVDEFFSKYGHLPLPPYISTDEQKEQYYQTVFAQQDGSVAAPTAALHFTTSLLEKLQNKGIITDYVTLHVGLGTFKPVDTPDIRDYHIHAEEIWLSPAIFTNIANYKQQNKHIIGVGTTVARTLETLPYVWKILRTNYTGSIENNNNLSISVSVLSSDSQVKTPFLEVFSQDTIIFWDKIAKDISLEQAKKYIVNREEIQGNASFLQPTNNQPIHIITKIFIYPGFQWRIVESLITNFHVPGSSLLMLVASAMGYDNMRKVYEYALSHEYRFLSFGDAMRIDRIKE